MGIMRWRKLPVEVDVLEWTGDNATEVMLFVGQQLQVSVPPRQMQIEMDCPPEAFTIIIPTLEGDHTAIKGDYIIKGVKGEFYPCKPDIFKMTYEKVS